MKPGDRVTVHVKAYLVWFFQHYSILHLTPSELNGVFEVLGEPFNYHGDVLVQLSPNSKNQHVFLPIEFLKLEEK